MEASSTTSSCLHTEPRRDYPHGRTRQKGQYDPELLKRIQREAKLKSTMPSDRVGYPEKDTR
jgi:cell division control protein 7